MAIKGFEKKDPMAGLNQLMQMMNQMNQMQDRRSQRYMTMYDEFSKSSKSFNNEELQTNLNRMENYYNQNVEGMSSEDIDVHNMLKSQYNEQIKKNNKFTADIDRRYSYSNDIMGFADEYSAVDDSRNFSYKTTSIGNDGKMVEQDNIVSLPNPEDYEGGLENLEYQKDHMRALEEVGGLEGYKQKKDEYKRYLKNQIQKQIGSYSDYMDTMVNEYGKSGRLNNLHLKDFAEIDESYAFIVDSLEDDGLFDEEEKSVYQSAIMQKSYRPIEQFIAKDQEIKSARRSVLLKDMQILKQEGDKYEIDGNSAIAALDMENEIDLQAIGITLDKKSPYNTTDDILKITNEQIKEAMLNPSEAEPDVVNYINSITNNIELTKKELKNKDSAYMKNDGGSFLQGMEQETWTTGLHDNIKGYVPPVYDLQKKKNPGFNVSKNLNKELSSSNIKVLDKDFETSNIQDKYKEGGNYASGGKKLNNEIDKLNQNIKDLENKPIKGEKTNVGSNAFSPSQNTINDFYMWPKKSGGLGFGIGIKKGLKGSDSSIPGLKNIIGHNNTEFTSSDLLKIEDKYNTDIQLKNKLVNEYRSLRNAGADKNSNEMINLQNEINEIYQTWFVREEFDLGTLSKAKFTSGFTKKMDWNLALEDSGNYNEGATVLYKFKEFLRNRFEEDKNKVQKQSNKVAKIKKNLS